MIFDQSGYINAQNNAKLANKYVVLSKDNIGLDMSVGKDTGGYDVNKGGFAINWAAKSYSNLKSSYITDNPTIIGGQTIYKPKKEGDPYLYVDGQGKIGSAKITGNLEDYKSMLEAGIRLGSIAIKPNTAMFELGKIDQKAAPLPVYNGLGVTNADNTMADFQAKLNESNPKGIN